MINMINNPSGGQLLKSWTNMKGVTMKAISVKQPWASLIVSGIKDIENRNWFTNYKGQLYIHASKRLDVQGADLLSRLHPELKDRINTFMNLTGGLIGYVNLVDCVTNHSSEWFHGKYGFVLNRPQIIDFYPMKGQLSIFDFDFSAIKSKAKQEKQLLLF